MHHEEREKLGLARYRERPDRVTPDVRNQTAVYAGIGFIISFLLKTFLDWEVNPAESEAWWNAVTAIVVPALPAIGGLYGAVRGAYLARRKVTPVDDPALYNTQRSDYERLVPWDEYQAELSRVRRRNVDP